MKVEVNQKKLVEPKNKRSCKRCIYHAKGWCKSFRITCSATSNARICSRYTVKPRDKKKIK